MEQQKIINKTIDFVKETLQDTESGHDWWHTYRVWKLSKHIAKTENADNFIVELGALLHDIADSKFHDKNENIGPKKAEEFLKTLNLDSNIIEQIKNIISNISFRTRNETTFKSVELDIIQDADRLDALGAIGIARAFNFGGHKNNTIYNPYIKPNTNMTKEEYKMRDKPTINHFYEKLLLLKDLMNTKGGQKIAEQRHAFMEQYLTEFYNEWEGKS
ncbi:MAG: HD domain-containing protein [DPANN group archaeon]|nr:HD domain-containing protein [DPANN group archaeon]